MIGSAGYCGDLIHIVSYDGGQLVVIFLRRFSCLEENVRVLRRTSDDGMLRIERVLSEPLHRIHID